MTKAINMMVSKRTCTVLFIVIFLVFSNLSTVYGKEGDRLAKGVWVTCFSNKKVLYSKKAAFDLIKFCKKKGINEVYLQLFRSGYAYFDTNIGDRSKYDAMLKSAGGDPIDLLLKEAQRCDVKVFAWVNVLCVGKNKNADIIKKFGNSILTRDQHLRPSMRTEEVNESDKYYLRDEQLFLEPGDLRVVEYMVSIIDEIITRYPDLAGFHLDYARYPYPIPFIPRSNFNKFGLTYGYGEENLKRFKKDTSLDALKMGDEYDNFLKWDNWKRQQVTDLVADISSQVKSGYPGMLVSCAVLPSPETAYSAAFQDWPGWLEDGIVDYVVLMNYTKNNQFTKEIVRSALSHRGKGKVYIGIGNFLMKNDPELVSEQEEAVESLNPDGIVYFSYDFL
jgi:uncharacterized lipoprotein YddW (UPF0748 family)